MFLDHARKTSAGLDRDTTSWTDASGVDHALGWGRPSRRGERRDPRRARVTLKHLNCTWCSVSMARRRNDDTTRRRNDDTCSKRCVRRPDHPSRTVAVRQRLRFRFEREFRRFVVSSFRRFDRPSRLNRKFFCVKEWYELRRRSEGVLLKVNVGRWSHHIATTSTSSDSSALPVIICRFSSARGGLCGWIWYGCPRSGGIETVVQKKVFHSYMTALQSYCQGRIFKGQSNISMHAL